jgi:hypothetical protein
MLSSFNPAIAAQNCSAKSSQTQILRLAPNADTTEKKAPF